MSTIISKFKETAGDYLQRKALVFMDAENIDHLVSYNWKQYYNMARKAASAFLALGLERGEGVSILGFNSVEWFVANMGAILAGGISVGLYTTNSGDVCKYIIEDSNSTIVVVDTIEQLDKILKSVDTDKLRGIICCEKGNKNIFEYPANVFYWGNFIDTQVESGKLRILSNQIKKDDCSTLIYTSGTTGDPKGVMLSHHNILWTIETVLNEVGITGDEPKRVLSYLPLSHVAAQMIDMYTALVVGGETWFARRTDLSKGTLGETLRVVRPHIFIGVPRVWIKIMNKMREAGENSSRLKKKIAAKAKEIGLEKHMRDEIGNDILPVFWKLFDKIVYSKVKKILGLDCCEFFLTGAAPIPNEVLEYFASLNIPIGNMYGQTESSGPVTISYPGCMKIGSCGKPLPGTKIKIDKENKEVLVKGPHVMLGYLNKPIKTKETVIDGWLRTGDIGKIDVDGFLHITDRLKNIIITEGGENIPPVLVENAVKKELPIISNCMLIGDNRHYLTILITILTKTDENNRTTDKLDGMVIRELNNTKIETITEAKLSDKFNKYIQDGIDRYNNIATSKAQKIQRFTILDKDFTIEGGELGPTLKLKRRVVLDKYKNEIDSMYKRIK